MRVPTLAPPTYRRITAFALGALAFIVVTGAAVRLTESGLGCPEWPNCEPGRLTPHDASDFNGMVEFTNRTITGLVSVAVILAVLGAMWRRPHRRDLVLLAWGLVAGVVGQIVLGGVTVLFDLWPPLVMGHFLLSVVLLWNAVWLHHRAGEPEAPAVCVISPRARLLVRATLSLTAVVVFTGTIVTASGPHAGDAEVDRLGPDVADVARVHGVSVMLLLTVLVATLVVLRAEDAPTGVHRTARWLFGVLLAQAAVGYVQYFTDVPALLVGLHVAGAVATWCLAVWLSLETVTRAAPQPSSSSFQSSSSRSSSSRSSTSSTLALTSSEGNGRRGP